MSTLTLPDPNSSPPSKDLPKLSPVPPIAPVNISLSKQALGHTHHNENNAAVDNADVDDADDVDEEEEEDVEETPPSTDGSTIGVTSSTSSSRASSSRTPDEFNDDSQPSTPLLDGGLDDDDYNEEYDDRDGQDNSDNSNSDDNSDEEDENNAILSTTTTAPLSSPLRLTKAEIAAGITICTKNNLKVDKFNFGKSKNGKAGNAEFPHNELMTIATTSALSKNGMRREPTVVVVYPPYIDPRVPEEEEIGEGGSLIEKLEIGKDHFFFFFFFFFFFSFYPVFYSVVSDITVCITFDTPLTNTSF